MAVKIKPDEEAEQVEQVEQVETFLAYKSDPSDPNDSVKEAAYHASIVAKTMPDDKSDEAE